MSAVRFAPDGWLGAQLGRPAFRVTTPVTAGPDDVRDAVRRQRADVPAAFFDAKIEAGRIPVVDALEAEGFRVVDLNLTFARPSGALLEDPSIPVRVAGGADRAAVVAIAERTFQYSRFHLDPRVGPQRANAMRRAWMDGYFDGRRGDRVLVAEIDGRIAGFIALLRPSDDATISVIDLVGTDRDLRRRGVARALVDASLRQPGIAAVRVGTQAANVPSVRLYEGCGFRLVQAAYVLHAHPENRTDPTPPGS